ncbi:MAG: hypothetical protein O3C43_03990 [Verrucomicrobia bacterium]|nr:hypothetical protein [Verrucomicrobiota bacterium]
MKHKSIFSIFVALSAIALASTQDVSAIELATENITIEAKFFSTDYDRMYFTFYGESTDSWNQAGYTVETTPRSQQIEPYKKYRLVVSGLYSPDTYDLSVTVPIGYAAYISDAETLDLILRPKVADVTQGGSSDTYLPLTASENPGFGVSTSIAADRPLWKLGMGVLKNGETAGSINIREDEISGLLFTPQDLDYTTLRNRHKTT